ncbi:hypothetical protein DPMN_191289 [Dreissena polymorpha]|uniref:Uncharacterized protein n=1 Tax=Dreissena polymorpha TaxID=45954 RepID=A0A9D4B6K0_DREPO|nr:hypothetical protein DPMN_191289 [Dreissena polymorpha]
MMAAIRNAMATVRQYDGDNAIERWRHCDDTTATVRYDYRIVAPKQDQREVPLIEPLLLLPDLQIALDREHAESLDEMFTSLYHQCRCCQASAVIGAIASHIEDPCSIHVPGSILVRDATAAMVYDHTNYVRCGPVYPAAIKAFEYAVPEVFKEFIEGHFVVRLKEKTFNGIPVDKANEWINIIEKAEQNAEFYAPIQKVKSKTCAYLYKQTVSEKQIQTKILKADRKLMQRLFKAANSGRAVETASVLGHELSDGDIIICKG